MYYKFKLSYSENYDHISLPMINHFFFHINSRLRFIRFVAIAFSVVLILLIPGVPKSYAHAFVIKSDPSPSQSLSIPPSKVDVYFSEPVDLRYSKLIVLDSNGKQVDNKDIQNINNDQTTLSVTLPAGLKDGAYTISTKVLSQTDGHVTDNAFVFGIGESTVLPISSKNGGSANPAFSQLYIPEAIARFPALVGQVMIVGAAFATLWLWRPISKISWLKDLFQQTRNRIDRNLIILTIIGSIILVSSDFAIIYVQANSINVGISEAIATKFGNVWIVRTILSLILLAISLFIYTRRLKKSNDLLSTSKKQVISILAIGIMTLVTTSLIGHGAANGQILPLTIDFIHNLAASVWIGGVIYLAFIVVPILRRSTSLEDYVKVSLLSLLIPRFSTIPVVILGIIVVTGPLLLYILESNIALTLASVYGKTLIVKLSLAATMIGIGGYNQMIIYRQAYNNVSVLATRTTKSSLSSSSSSSSVNNSNAYRDSNNILRKVRRSLQRNHPNENNSNLSQTSYIISRFSKSTKAEAIVGIALLAAVAVLVNTGLPANEFQNQLKQQSAAATTITLPSTLGAATNQQQGFISTKFLEADNSSSRAILSIDPFTPGNNIFKISYLDSNKNPLDIRSVQLKYTQTENGIGPIKVDAQKVSKGVFSASAAFGIPGPWNLQIEAVQGKANTLNLITSYDLLVKPKLSQLTFNVQEFKISNSNITTAQPLYPLYDKSRNVIWVGDTVIDSGKMLEFNLNSDKYIQHKITGTSIITRMALDSHNQLWFLDPLLKNLGQYNPETETSKIYKIPTQGIPSSIAIDSADNIWLTSSHTNDILRFDAQTKNFTILKLPSTTIVTDPIDITIDQSSGQIWVAELAGKLANIDPTKSYKVTEYTPTTTGNKNSTLKSPTALLVDPTTGNIFISEHDGQAVSVFNPILKTFNQFPILNKNGLPFGMAMDNYGNLWVAEHTVNKIAVIDPQTGASKEATIPTQNPFVQWITSDSKGNIWFAEQQGNSLGVITMNSNPLQPGSAVIQQRSNVNDNNQSNSSNNTIPKLSFNYPDIVGPSFAAGIIVSTLFYAKAVIDLKKSVAKLAAHH